MHTGVNTRTEAESFLSVILCDETLFTLTIMLAFRLASGPAPAVIRSVVLYFSSTNTASAISASAFVSRLDMYPPYPPASILFNAAWSTSFFACATAPVGVRVRPAYKGGRGNLSLSTRRTGSHLRSSEAATSL